MHYIAVVWGFHLFGTCFFEKLNYNLSKIIGKEVWGFVFPPPYQPLTHFRTLCGPVSRHTLAPARMLGSHCWSIGTKWCSWVSLPDHTWVHWTQTEHPGSQECIPRIQKDTHHRQQYKEVHLKQQEKRQLEKRWWLNSETFFYKKTHSFPREKKKARSMFLTANPPAPL